MDDMDRWWLTRLRWRLRGAWLWPTFVVLTVVEGVLLHELPITGDEGPGVPAGVLLAGFLNLIVMVLLAPLGGRLLRRRRPDFPRVVATDYAGTVLVLAFGAGILALGLVHHPSVMRQQEDFDAQSSAARMYVAHSGPPDARANVALADSVRIDDHLYRTCVPITQPDRAYCLYVDTSQAPPGITVDTNRATNADYAGRRSGPGG